MQVKFEIGFEKQNNIRNNREMREIKNEEIESKL